MTVDPAAVEAGAKAIALRNTRGASDTPLSSERAVATSALTAAVPILLAAHEAQVRAQVAAEIRANCHARRHRVNSVVTDSWSVLCGSCAEAAHIANPEKD